MTLKNQAPPTIPAEKIRVSRLARKAADKMTRGSLRVKAEK